jgi:hypothetical protein
VNELYFGEFVITLYSDGRKLQWILDAKKYGRS